MRVLRLCVVFGLTAAMGCQRGAPLSTGRWIDTTSVVSSVGVGSMPMSIAISPDGQYAITTGNGYREEICAVRISDGKLADALEFPNATTQPSAEGRGGRGGSGGRGGGGGRGGRGFGGRGRGNGGGGGQGARSNGLYYGIAFGPDGRLYAAQGAAHTVAILSLSPEGKLRRVGQIGMRQSDFPAGVAIDGKGRLYVTQNDPITPTYFFGTPASVSVHDTASGREIGRYTFADELGLSNFPLAVTVNDDGSRLYVASERDDAVYVLDAADPANISLIAKVATGANPTAVLLNKDRSRLYVANGDSDTISVIDTGSDAVIATVLVRPEVARDLAGATPTGLALSGDEKTLYATLGDLNALAVIDLGAEGGAALDGYIPAGWYPMAVAVAGGQLWVTNAKGDRPRTPHDFSSGRTVTSPLYLFEGTLWRLAIPPDDQLAELTAKCLADARLTADQLNAPNPLEGISRQSGAIQHVIYVIKENRSYDQVFGDLPSGNGDANRCLFGREVTPNEHALAERFVLLDNFYDCGDVSGDGWTWSTEAQANEYTIRNVPYEYSRLARQYDFEGSNNRYPSGGLPATGPDGAPLSDVPGLNGGKPIKDVAESSGGHLWDTARREGLTFRNYGCFITFGVKDGDKTIIPDNYPASAGVQPGGHDLGGITDVDYRKFDLNFPDSDGPAEAGRNWSMGTFGRAKLPSRIAEWKREFNLMLAKDPTGGAVPALEMIRMGTDHTSAARGGSPTPRCMVADNDYAVGELVDAVSHSPIWNSTVIVILEDDAQNGPDHVDAHRSICLVVSPWIQRGRVDHSFQNTVSAIKTMECLLNLPPMCQYDAASGVIGDWDNAPRNSEAYAAIRPAEAIFGERNPGGGERGPVSPEEVNAQDSGNVRLKTPADLAMASAAMDLSRADQVPADLMNRVIWKTVRGMDSEMPPTPHRISAGGPVEKDDDGD
jgi:YVTN family beta-propeller protein